MQVTGFQMRRKMTVVRACGDKSQCFGVLLKNYCERFSAQRQETKPQQAHPCKKTYLLKRNTCRAMN